MVNIAVIGAGFMGKAHGEAYTGMEHAKLQAIFDVSEEKGSALAKELGCKFYSDFDKMINECQIDVIDICLPTVLHEQFVIRAAENKKHIFCEKPVTLDVASLDRMLKSVNENKVLFFVGQVVRFWPEYRAAKEAYDTGRIGKLNYVYAARLSEHPAWSEWYRRPENSGGGLLDLHLHDVDYLCYLLGEVDSVYASGAKNGLGCWNFVNSTLHFSSGISASVQGVLEMAKGYPFTMELRLVGEKATFAYHMSAGANLDEKDKYKRENFLYENGVGAPICTDTSDAYVTELAHFVSCADQKKESEVITPASVRKVLCVIEALKESLETGQKVKVNYENRV